MAHAKYSHFLSASGEFPAWSLGRLRRILKVLRPSLQRVSYPAMRETALAGRLSKQGRPGRRKSCSSASQSLSHAPWGRLGSSSSPRSSGACLPANPDPCRCIPCPLPSRSVPAVWTSFTGNTGLRPCHLGQCYLASLIFHLHQHPSDLPAIRAWLFQ